MAEKTESDIKLFELGLASGRTFIEQVELDGKHKPTMDGLIYLSLKKISAFYPRGGLCI